MPAVTGIEVGADACVLVRARARRAGPTLSAAHFVDASEWPDHDSALTDLLRRVRRGERFPRRARVVGWGLHQSATLSDPATRAYLQPIADAGFRVEAVFTPPQALARLAAQVTADRARPESDAATAWLALNRCGAAIAIVRGGDLLYSRTFDWNYYDAPREHEQLLQRYSLVAHLAPEVRHGMQMARSAYAARVEAAVTCGDLPDLRSLTRPLIEELDVEVETLDSEYGVQFAGRAQAEGLAAKAPALRIACAAAAAHVPRGIQPAPLMPAAAALAGIGVLGWWLYSQQDTPPPPAPERTAAAAPAGRVSGQTPPPPEASRLAAVPPEQAGPTTGSTAAPQRAEARTPDLDPAPASSGPRPVVSPQVAPPGADPSPRREVTAPASSAVDGPDVTPAFRPRASWSPRPGAVPPRDGQDSTARRGRAAAPARPAEDTPRRRPAGPPLTDPLPTVNSILISADRRLAILDGDIVGEGDTVGPRVLVRIESASVVLREPSGHEVRASIRGRTGPGPEAHGR